MSPRAVVSKGFWLLMHRGAGMVQAVNGRQYRGLRLHLTESGEAGDPEPVCCAQTFSFMSRLMSCTGPQAAPTCRSEGRQQPAVTSRPFDLSCSHRVAATASFAERIQREGQPGTTDSAPALSGSVAMDEASDSAAEERRLDGSPHGKVTDATVETVISVINAQQLVDECQPLTHIPFARHPAPGITLKRVCPFTGAEAQALRRSRTQLATVPSAAKRHFGRRAALCRRQCRRLNAPREWKCLRNVVLGAGQR